MAGLQKSRGVRLTGCRKKRGTGRGRQPGQEQPEGWRNIRRPSGSSRHRNDDPWNDGLRHRVESLLEAARSEEHTSELQSLMRISYAVFCLKKKTHTKISR